MALKDWLFEPEAGAAKTAAPPAPAAPTGPVFAPAPASPTFSGLSGTPTAAANPALVADIETALAKRNLPAYAQFGTLLQKLERTIPDEGTRFASALAAGEVTGLQAATVRQAYEARAEALTALTNSFEQQATADRTAKLAKATAARDTATAEVARIEAEFKRIEQQLTAARSQQATAERAVQDAAAEADRFHSEMLTAFATVRATVLAERDRVLRFLTL